MKFTLLFLSALFIFLGNIVNAELTEAQKKGFLDMEIVNSTQYTFDVSVENALIPGFLPVIPGPNMRKPPLKLKAAYGKGLAAQDSKIKIKLQGGKEVDLTVDWRTPVQLPHLQSSDPSQNPIPIQVRFTPFGPNKNTVRMTLESYNK